MRIAAVIVHHAHVDDTLRCLRQLDAAGVAARDIVVVANGAPDADRAAIVAAQPDTALIVLAANVGFATGANVGLAHALEGTADAALLINPDVTFGSGLVEALAASPGLRHEVRMPVIVCAEDPDRTWFAGAWRQAWPGRWRLRAAGDPRLDVDVLWACCWLVGAEAWRRVGPFDPGYFLYFEDVAWCDRARAKGVALRVVPEARLAHTVGGSFGGSEAAKRRYWMSRGAVRYARERGRWAIVWRALVDAANALRWLASGRRQLLRAHLAGIRDGWRAPSEPRTAVPIAPGSNADSPAHDSVADSPAHDSVADSPPHDSLVDSHPHDFVAAPVAQPVALAHPDAVAQPVAVANADSPHRFSFIMASAHLPTTPAALRAILAQSAADQVLEVLVFGAAAPDWPEDARIVAIPIEPGPACAAYNAGLLRASGTHVVFVDADCCLAPDWLERISARHRQGWDAVAGGVVFPEGQRLSVAYNMTQFHDFLAGARTEARSWLPTMNLSVDRRLAGRIGPFRSDIARSYDVDWTLRLGRAGAALLFDGGVRATHAPCGITPEILERTWFAGGACSQSVRRAHAGRIRAPRLLGWPRAVHAAAPTLATLAAARCVWRNRRDQRVWGLIPEIWRTKRAWCRGAEHAARHGPLAPADYGYRPVGAVDDAPGVDAPDSRHDPIDVVQHKV